jgi:hypothetical protein
MISPSASVVPGRRRATNGLCSAPDAPRRLETAVRPGRSGVSTTCVSRAHAPLNCTNVQAASGRSSERLIAVSTVNGTRVARITLLRVIPGRSAKSVSRTSISRPVRSSARAMAVSASSWLRCRCGQRH